MRNEKFSKGELRTLLLDTSEQVSTVLLSTSHDSNQYYYQHFASISLKALKYVNQYLNQVNNDQAIGQIVDQIIAQLDLSLQDYKGRNVFVHSMHITEAENMEEDDEIYHFMNTRNNLLPLECLDNYEKDRQRKELEEYIQQLNMPTLHAKESKRSLLLPKSRQKEFLISRKTTFDLPGFSKKELDSLPSELRVDAAPLAVLSENVQIQTQMEFPNEVPLVKVEISSQCENAVAAQNLPSSSSNPKIKPATNSKTQERKKNANSFKKNKIKVKTNSSNVSLINGAEPLLQKKSTLKQMQSSQCSMKLLRNNESNLKIFSQINISVINCDGVVVREEGLIAEPNLSIKRIAIIKQLYEQNINSPFSDKLSSDLEYQQQELKSEAQQNQQKSIISKDQIIQQNNIFQRSIQYITTSNKANNEQGKKQPKIKQLNQYRSSQKKYKPLPTSNVKITQSAHYNQAQAIKQTTKKQANSSSFKKSATYQTYVENGERLKKKRFTCERDSLKQWSIKESFNESLQLSRHFKDSKLNFQSAINNDNVNNRVSNSFKTVSGINKDALSAASLPSQQDYLMSRQSGQQQVTKFTRISNQRLKINQTSKEPFRQQKNQMFVITNQKKLNEAASRIAMQESPQKENKKLSLFIKNIFKTSNGGRVSTKLECINKLRNNDCKTVNSSPQHNQPPPIRQSLHMSPRRIPFSKLLSQEKLKIVCLEANKEVTPFVSRHYELEQFKRKLRNRTNNNNLGKYIELIETAHRKFCGENCLHLKELYKEKQGNLNQQILRLFKLLK